MTELIKTLEKIAELDGEFADVVHRENDVSSYKLFGAETIVSFIPRQLEEKQWLVFGAICEKIEAEGFKWTMPNDGVSEKYVCELWPQDVIGAESVCEYSSENPATAAAKALLAALEAKQVKT